MSSVPEDIKDVLVEDGCGVFAATSGWGIYIGSRPDQPNDVISITQLDATIRSYIDSDISGTFENITIRIEIRGADFTTGWQKARDVKTSILSIPSQTIDGFLYEGFSTFSGPYQSGIDDRGRLSWDVVFLVMRKEVESST